jgi:hypothetical protein
MEVGLEDEMSCDGKIKERQVNLFMRKGKNG